MDSISPEDHIKNLRDQFNQQRAKMKELYLQKEGECKELQKKLFSMKKEIDDIKSQLVIAEYNKEKDLEENNRRNNEEIQTLQQLLQETVDESTKSISDIKKLTEENERLRQEIQENKESQDSRSLDPFLNQVKTIARKIKITSNNSENAAVSNKYAQEDAEVLRSLVVPLESEIHQLKEKLRDAYDQNEKLKEKLEPISKFASESQENMIKDLPENVSEECEKCVNYEIQLQQSQKINQDEVDKLVKIISDIQNDLEKESKLRLDLETKWQEKRDSHKEEIQKLTDELQEQQQKIQEIWLKYDFMKGEVNQELLKLIEERQKIYEHLETLQKDNDYLSGSYLDNSQFLKDQAINLPQNIEELHELVLKLHENLIVSKTGCEFSETKCISFRDESSLLRDQIHQREKDRIFMEQKLNHRIQSLEEKIKQQHQAHQRIINEKEALEKIESDYKKQTSELRMQNIELNENNDRLEKANHDLKSKVTLIQQELATNETVQKDFVKLSQSLQMQLEKIRSADQNVRWQDEDDVDNCPNCKKEFTVTRRKQHCRHCGTIYCQYCLNKTVKSGPNKRTCKVCEVCHFLLEQNTAPYFSKQPPKSPV